MNRKSRSSAETRQAAFGKETEPEVEVDRVLSADERVVTSNSELGKLRCLIGLSSDYYWELDRQFRVSHVWYGEENYRQRAAELLIGKARWDIGGVPVEGTWNDHKATLQAHEPFDNFIVEWTDKDGSTRFLSFSGRPRFGESGHFMGYMGVTQDITELFWREKLTGIEGSCADILADGQNGDPLLPALNFVCQKLDWRYGRYWEIESTGGDARLIASTSRCEASVDHCIETVCRSQEIVWQSGEGKAGPGNKDAEQQSRVFVPVIESSAVAAVLEFAAPSFTGLRGELARFLSHLAIQLSAARARAITLARLKESEQRFVSTVELAAIGICHIGLRGEIIHANQQMSEILGYSKSELLTKTVKEISHPDDRNVSDLDLDRLLTKEIESFKIEKRYLRKDGQPVWVRINTVIKWDARGEPLHHISVVEDISDKKAAEDRIEHLATHDVLTGLPNRALFSELLSSAVLGMGRNPDRICALLFIDLDRFKAINDSLGHQSGDAILKTAAERIRKNVRSTDCVARFGGDEFVALLTDLDKPATAEIIARKVIVALQKPIQVRDHNCRVTASIGVAVCPDDGDDPHILLRNADIAMYAAKQTGRNDVQRYSIDMTTMSVKQITLETHLRLGLERKEFRVQYQPRVDAQSGRIIGAEALLRWWNSELGTIPPVQFMPVAEETGLILPIGRWVLRKACEQSVSWLRKGLGPVFVSVNLSPTQFTDPELVNCIQESLDRSGLMPEHLELEIAEGTWTAEIEQSIEIAESIRALGVKLAMDDFGTSCTSIAQLKRLPLDTIKIDRSYIREIGTSEEDREKAETIFAIGRSLGVSVVGEGVENAEQFELLSKMQCTQMQGFYFGKSCHPEEMARLLRDGQTA